MKHSDHIQVGLQYNNTPWAQVITPLVTNSYHVFKTMQWPDCVEPWPQIWKLCFSSRTVHMPNYIFLYWIDNGNGVIDNVR